MIIVFSQILSGLFDIFFLNVCKYQSRAVAIKCHENGQTNFCKYAKIEDISDYTLYYQNGGTVQSLGLDGLCDETRRGVIIFTIIIVGLIARNTSSVLIEKQCQKQQLILCNIS